MSIDNRKLVDEYKRIKKNHLEAERHFFARINLPSSVIRVFNEGTKRYIHDVLLELDIKSLGHIRNQSEFKSYFEEQLELLSHIIYKTNKNNNRIMPGYKWGHSTKILCLYLRDFVIHSRQFNESTSNCLSYLLYTPIDNIIMKKLRQVGYKVPFKSIKEIDTPSKFYDVQEALYEASSIVRVPRVWFDDNWGQRG